MRHTEYLAPRTIEEWLHLIPYEPARQQALDNFKIIGFGNSLVYTLYDALHFAFPWHNTPEGKEYWSKIYTAIKRSYHSIKLKPQITQEPTTMCMVN